MSIAPRRRIRHSEASSNWQSGPPRLEPRRRHSEHAAVRPRTPSHRSQLSNVEAGSVPARNRVAPVRNIGSRVNRQSAVKGHRKTSRSIVNDIRSRPHLQADDAVRSAACAGGVRHSEHGRALHALGRDSKHAAFARNRINPSAVYAGSVPARDPICAANISCIALSIDHNRMARSSQ